MSTPPSDTDTVWQNIENAGSITHYIQSELEKNGFVVPRKDTDKMSKSELARYKKALKAESAEKRRLKKLAWQVYRQNNIVHLGDGVYWNDLATHDKWDLAEPEARAQENDLPQLDTPQQLAEALQLTIPELRWLCYHREAAKSLHYTRFTIPKRDGGERAIWAPLPRLKATQHWILSQIVERLLIHGSAHGFIPGRSIATNAEAHRDSQVIVKLDIKDFFPTVSLPRVKGVFRKAGYREQVATLLALLCTEAPREVVTHRDTTYYVATGPRSLPQGAPTSPALTNVLCLTLDQRLSGFADKMGWRYTRYADDLTFSLPKGKRTNQKIGALIGTVKQIVKEEGFTIHPSKTKVHRSGGAQRVTGLVVNGSGEVRVPREIKRKIRAAIHNLKQGKPLAEGETRDTLIGYAAYIAMTDPELGHKMLEEIGQA